MGGALTYLERLIRELDARPRGHEITIVVRQGVVDCAAKNIRLAIVDASICESPIRIFLWQQITLPILLWKEKFDLLYSTANFATFFSPCPQILLVRIPLYFSELYKTHILRKKSLSSRLTFTLRSLLISASQKIATHTLFPTASLQQDFFTPKPVDSVRTSINWYGTDPSAFSRNTVPLRTPVRILCTSHYSDYKNYSSLLEGLLRLKNEGSLQFLLTATIDPSLPLFKTVPTASHDLDLMKALGDSLNALGPLPPPQLPALYADADIFVWPSLAESFGHPLIEAMAAGLPIVCSDLPVNRELCADAALYVSPLDSSAWARTIRELALNKGLQDQLIRKTQERIHYFRWDDHVSRILELFSSYEQRVL